MYDLPNEKGNGIAEKEYGAKVILKYKFFKKKIKSINAFHASKINAVEGNSTSDWLTKL